MPIIGPDFGVDFTVDLPTHVTWKRMGAAASAAPGGSSSITIAPATITYRQIDASGEPQFGQGFSNYLTDIDAVAQAIRTRLLLFLKEWWSDQNDGLPLWQEILGQAKGNNQQAVNLILSQRIFGTPYVTGITDVQSSYSSASRGYTFACKVQTQFGTIQIDNIPFPNPPVALTYGEGRYGQGIYPQ